MNRRGFLWRTAAAALGPVAGALVSKLPKQMPRIEFVRDPLAKTISIVIDHKEMWRGLSLPTAGLRRLLDELVVLRDVAARGGR